MILLRLLQHTTDFHSINSNKNMTAIKSFFERCDCLSTFVTKQLSHININWELTWDDEKQEYEPEENSFAPLLNQLIEELCEVDPPARYHDNEDRLAEYVISNLKWNIKKANGRWVGNDYTCILEQGSFDDFNEKNLIAAAAGRIKAAVDRNQLNFDEMEESHRIMLGNVLACILFHRFNK